jgi:hypothetical protein
MHTLRLHALNRRPAGVYGRGNCATRGDFCTDPHCSRLGVKLHCCANALNANIEIAANQAEKVRRERREENNPGNVKRPLGCERMTAVFGAIRDIV